MKDIRLSLSHIRIAPSKLLIAASIFFFLIFAGFILYVSNVGLRQTTTPPSRANKLVDLRTTIAKNKKEILLMKLLRDPKTGIIRVGRIKKVLGFLPSVKKSKVDDKNNPYIFEVLTNGIVTYSTKFNFLSEIQSPPPQPGAPTNNVDDSLKLREQEAYIKIPTTDSTQLRVRNLQTGTSTILDIREYSQQLSTRATSETDKTTLQVQQPAAATQSTASTPETDTYYDIVFISSHYSDFNAYASDVDQLIQYLFSIQPYSTLQSGIRIWRIDNLQDLGCVYNGRLIQCNIQTAQEIASQVPNDTIVIVENNSEYGGAGYLGTAAVTYNNMSDQAKQVMIHEMGHSVGYLGDEYDFGVTTPTDPNFPNCSMTNPCKWNGTAGTGCFLVCGYSNMYRPSDNSSVMRTLTPDGGVKYGPVSDQTMFDVIASHLGTIPTTAPTATPTPIPPTATPTPACLAVTKTPANKTANFFSTGGIKSVAWSAVTNAVKYSFQMDDLTTATLPASVCNSPQGKDTTGEECVSIGALSTQYNFTSGRTYHWTVAGVNSCNQTGPRSAKRIIRIACGKAGLVCCKPSNYACTGGTKCINNICK